jgi:hypothetical protein
LLFFIRYLIISRHRVLVMQSWRSSKFSRNPGHAKNAGFTSNRPTARFFSSNITKKL